MEAPMDNMNNKAPEKIYYTQTENGTHYYTEGIPFERKYVEYTRTDAFIEKACENLKKLMYDNLMFQGRLHREEVINSFIEDFRKYMEGGEEWQNTES